jgi:hypothetical protein
VSFFSKTVEVLMRAMNVTLDFACCTCAGPVHVKLKCEGPGLLREDPKAGVMITCPMCNCPNDLVFDPSGVVHQVAPGLDGNPFPEPSLN